MTSALTHGLVTTDAVTRAFADEAVLAAMCRFEAALARAEAAAGVIPDTAAAVISDVALSPLRADVDRLRASLRANATVSIGVVLALTARVAEKDATAAGYVHWGATSQDVFDTGIVLCLRDAWPSIATDQRRLASALDELTVRHADTVMLGRTLLQPALPTTFGLKTAGWLGSVTRSWALLSDAFDRTQVLQFGGAAGTLASLGAHGPAVERALAAELGLEIPDAPWHVHRDRLAAFVAAAGVYVGAVGKVAGDITLLMQAEVGEVAEAGGGSSAMPHKRNPARCAAVLACAHRMPGLVATMLSAMNQQHERGAGGWHAEASTLVDAVQTTAAATAALADALESLSVDEARMRQNIEATRGVIFAERVVMAIAPELGRTAAAALVKGAVEEATRSGRSLADVVAATPGLAERIPEARLAELFQAGTYTGSAELFRTRLRSASGAGHERT
jgi:3-carboxy-cis,cis-muconate cycloisomerase